MSDIVDRIDELVDAQLQQERSGYDHNINQDKCWHCGRDWHGLPITERIAAMYARRTYDESYSLAEDDSPVLCEGSDFIGPIREQPARSAAPLDVMEWLGRILTWTNPFLPSVDAHRRWWRTTLPADAILTNHGDSVTVTIGDRDLHVYAENIRLIGDGDRDRRIDVLLEHAPDIGGTWEPLTAPGVVQHPDPERRGLVRTGPQPWDYRFGPYEGMRIAYEVNGQMRTAVVTHVDEDPGGGDVSLTCDPIVNANRPYRYEGFGFRADDVDTPTDLEVFNGGD